MAASRTFLQFASDTSDATTYTFASQNLGAADSGRYIIAVVHCRSTSSATLSSASIAGVSATIVVQNNTIGVTRNVSAIIIAAVPSGTTGDVVITFSSGALRCGIQLYRVLGIDGLAASDSDSSTAAAPSVSIDIPEGGIAIAGASSASGSATCTWTNLDEDSDSIIESLFAVTSASNEFATLQTGLTITATFTASSGPVGVFASWGPAATGGAVPVFVNHYRQQGIM
jgi:hypothetical protein